MTVYGNWDTPRRQSPRPGTHPVIQARPGPASRCVSCRANGLERGPAISWLTPWSRQPGAPVLARPGPSWPGPPGHPGEARLDASRPDITPGSGPPGHPGNLERPGAV